MVLGLRRLRLSQSLTQLRPRTCEGLLRGAGLAAHTLRGGGRASGTRLHLRQAPRERRRHRVSQQGGEGGVWQMSVGVGRFSHKSFGQDPALQEDRHHASVTIGEAAL